MDSLGMISGIKGMALQKILGAMSPAIAALILTGFSEGRRGIGKLLKNSFTAWHSAGWLIF